MPVTVLIVAPGVDIAKEYYLGITLDRARNTVTLIASAEGGVEIEEVAKKSPEKVIKEPLHPTLGMQAYQDIQMRKNLAAVQPSYFDVGFNTKVGYSLAYLALGGFLLKCVTSPTWLPAGQWACRATCCMRR